jgi:putative Holliday junction resolvase
MKRIGVAVGQTVTQTARPLKTIAAIKGIPQGNILDELIKKWRPDAMIVGIPLNMDGSIQTVSLHARQFVLRLQERYHLPVYEVDERLTTKAAREKIFMQGGYQALQEGQVDQVAATIILQNWFAGN